MTKLKFQKRTKKTAKSGRQFSGLVLPEEVRLWTFGILMFLVSLIIIFSFFGKAGPAGQLIMKVSNVLIGNAGFILPLLFVLVGLVFFSKKYKNKWQVILACFIFLFGICGILSVLGIGERGGGQLGYWGSLFFVKIFGEWIALAIFSASLVVSGLIFWYLLPPTFFLKKRKPSEEAVEEEPKGLENLEVKPEFEVKSVFPEKPAKKKFPFLGKKEKETEAKQILPQAETKVSEKETEKPRYELPPLNLLEMDKGTPLSGDIKANSLTIQRTFQNFGIKVDMAGVNIGPTVTQYTFKPAEGVKLSKITGLSGNLSLALAAHPIRIEAPIPGKSLVGIEIPNKTRTTVRLRNLLEDPSFQNNPSKLYFALGRDVAGSSFFADLSRMPHLLVAGSTGSGKTICLNSIILSLLFRNSPEALRFILIDPKRVEFPVYNELPHLLTPVILDTQRTVNVLKWLIGEMERRFEVLAGAKARDIISYNEIVARNFRSQGLTSKRGEGESMMAPMSYIVVIIDELADLMAVRGREIEAGIVRLAQMARAVGIHLVVATQRPSVEVITGLIKANITARISFQVASQVDSRTILDVAGAEKLLGSGDMLFVSAEVPKPKRLQGVYVSEKEVKRVVHWIKSKAQTQEYGLSEAGEIKLENELSGDMEKTLGIPEAELEGLNGEEDPLYEEAKRIVIEARKASASLLQRRLRLGYARAARLIDMLEERGVVGPADGAKPREVYAGRSEEKKNEIESITENESEDGFRKI